MANTTDSMGRPLFAGRSSVDVPFTRNVDGTVAYNGDRGQHSVQISESLTTLTGIDGGSAFMRVETPNGRRSVFEVIQSAMNSIETGAQIKGRQPAATKRGLISRCHLKQKHGHLPCREMRVQLRLLQR